MQLQRVNEIASIHGLYLGVGDNFGITKRYAGSSEPVDRGSGAHHIVHC